MERITDDEARYFARRLVQIIGGKRYFPALVCLAVDAYRTTGRSIDEAAIASLKDGLLSVTLAYGEARTDEHPGSLENHMIPRQHTNDQIADAGTVTAV